MSGDRIVKKARWTLGLLCHTLSLGKQLVKATAYQTLIRPQLEYVTKTWNPHNVDGVYCMEQIQKAFTLFLNYTSSYIGRHVHQLEYHNIEASATLHKNPPSIPM